MKKFFAFVLALCLICSMTVLAEAQQKQTILSTEIAESYTVTIPANVDIAFNAQTTNLPVEVTELRIKSDAAGSATQRCLAVNMTTDKQLTSVGGDNLAYTVNAESMYFTKAEVQNFVITIAQAAWNAAPAGSYTDTVTFSIEIIDK